MDKLLNYLGLAMRSGNLVSGDGAVLKAIRCGQAMAVVLARDAANNAKKKFADKCAFYRVPLIEYGSREQLGRSIGKHERVVLAVTDQGLARMIIQCWETSTGVKWSE